MSKPSVLIVDDEPDIVALIERTLKNEGFDVYTAYDGISALDIAAVDKPQVIVLDIMMPKVDGPTALKQLRAEPDFKETPVILFTAKALRDEGAGYDELGVIGLILKPFDPVTPIEDANHAVVETGTRADVQRLHLDLVFMQVVDMDPELGPRRRCDLQPISGQSLDDQLVAEGELGDHLAGGLGPGPDVDVVALDHAHDGRSSGSQVEPTGEDQGQDDWTHVVYRCFHAV